MQDVNWIRHGSADAPAPAVHHRRLVRLAWSCAAAAAVVSLGLGATASMFRRAATERLTTFFDVAIPPTNDAPSIAVARGPATGVRRDR